MSKLTKNSMEKIVASLRGSGLLSAIGSIRRMDVETSRGKMERVLVIMRDGSRIDSMAAFKRWNNG